MKKIISNVVVMSSALLASYSAFAGEQGDVDNGHLYAQVEVGKTELDVNKKSVKSSSIDKSDTSFTLRGGYQFPSQSTFHFGVEGGYLSLGKLTFKHVYGAPVHVGVKQKGWDVLGVITKDLNPTFNVFAKGGIAYIDQSYSVQANNLVMYRPVKNEKGILPEVAGGVGVKITPRLAVTGSVSHIFGEKNKLNSTKHRLISSTSASIGLKAQIG